MTSQGIKILLIEDAKNGIADLLSSIDAASLSLVVSSASVSAATLYLDIDQYDVLLLSSTEKRALHFLKEFRNSRPDVPVIAVAKIARDAVRAQRSGASVTLIQDELTSLTLAQSISELVSCAQHLVFQKAHAERYLALMDHANEIIYSHDLKGNYTSMNKAGERLTGYSLEEALRLNVAQVVAPEYQSVVAKMVREKLKGLESTLYEIEIITKDKRRLPLEVSTHFIFANGKPVGIQGVARDITARRRRETVLVESEQRYKQLVDEATDIIYRINLKGHFTFVNPIGAKVMQRPTEELLGLHYLELIREDYRKVAADFYRQQVVDRIRVTYLEFPTVAGDGSEIWIGQNVQLLMRNGEPYELQAVARDITQRKEIEEQLRLSEERFSKAFNFTPLSMSLTSLTDMRIVDVNKSFLALNDYRRDEVLGRTAKELNLWADEAEERLFLEELKRTRSIRDREIKVLGKNGEMRTYVISAEIISLATEECVLAITNDLTEHRALEEQLRQAQRMEAIGQLAGGVAHDFNNVLTAITGYSELLLRRLGITHPASKDVEQIQKAGRRAAGLTRQLLAFSRRQILEVRLLDLNSLVADMQNMLERLIGEDINLVPLLKPELGAVKVDRGQIEQVLLNLVVNARDAMPTGGEITIETKDVYLDESYAGSHISVSPGHYIMLAVADTGLGMDAATRKRIFEPFFTTKDVRKGTGLGLSTVYGIVKQSNGYIWVYSELGQGTTFKIYFPWVDEFVTSESDAIHPGEAPQGNETILLVEDEDQLRDLAEHILKRSGYTVLTATNGVEGLQRCKDFQSEIDLLITDVIMPMKSGRELAEQVAQLRPQAKVLYMSGYTDDSIVRHGVLEEHVAFLQKPFTPTALAVKVREVLDQSTDASPR